MKCPIDDTPLSVSSREGVEIDFCPQCRGVWLDRGELDKIIDRASTAIAGASMPAPEPRYDERRDERASGGRRDESSDDRKQRRKRSFLDDLFDFD
jgi:Zn-finger nucleic acid-binding protein